MTPAAQFADYFRDSNATPERLALEAARIAYPSLDVEQQLGQLDALAEYVQRELAAGQDAPARESGAEGFLRVVTQQLDFHGDQENYYDPRNSLLPDVLERRQGLPIMLCLVCLAIGRRLGLNISGLGFPNHFLALYRDDESEIVLDPFLGITLAHGDVERHLARLLGRPVQLAPDAWRPLTAQQIALRILHNLRNAYLTAKDLPMVVRVLDHLIAVNPAEPQYWRERGLIHHRERRWVEAHYDLRRYLLRVGLLAALAPPGESAPAAAKAAVANQGDKRVLEMYREASVMLSRIN
jgi:regulator of sirC expression with transglutaminase-like and TPR domain